MQIVPKAPKTRNNPRFAPAESPLSSTLDTAAQLEADHAYKAREYAELARFHAQQARAARAIRKQAERLLWGAA